MLKLAHWSNIEGTILPAAPAGEDGRPSHAPHGAPGIPLSGMTPKGAEG